MLHAKSTRHHGLARLIWGVALAGLGGCLPLFAAGWQEAGAEDQPTNRLARETSPYLLLHARNPVDWYPWGSEAFARAKAENKPIFLSVGYSSCYWCHVMERESFMDPEIARFLNEHFVSIKVDREERPDVDQIYMTALQAFSTGGWPMSVFLLPDGRPFFGGTYFPPRDRDGATGFLTLLKSIARAWEEKPAEVEKAATGLTQIVRRRLETTGTAGRRIPLSRALADQGRARLVEQFDPEYGGFNESFQNPRRPKFPEPVILTFLLDQHRRQSQPGKAAQDPAPRDEKPQEPLPSAGGGTSPLAMVLLTLDRMARGGIRDQLGGGYHRYAVSRYWIVPHFEKMLYDNAQLASVHLTTYELTGDPRWRDEAEATFSFVARTMTDPEGGFYSSLDAETESGEGAYYVWSRAEVRSVLGDGPDYDLFAQVYGLKREPNFEEGRYVLLEPRPRPEQAAALNLSATALEAKLQPLRARLLEARQRRPSPRCDDKILTAWNGLMIAALADGFRVLKKEAYRQAAEKAAGLILARMRDDSGRLLRSYRQGSAKLPAYLEDYAFFGHGLLRLHAATGDPRWLAQARELVDRMIDDFHDPRDGGFFFTAGDHERLLARPKEYYDHALPSSNGMAVRVLMELYRATSEPRYLELAGRTLEAFSTPMAQNPAAMPIMLVGLLEYLDASSRRIVPRPLVAGGLAPPPPRVVTATARLTDDRPIAAGSEVRAVVTLEIQEGWHIYANPTGVELLKPTTLALGPHPSVLGFEVEYPPGQPKVLGSLGSEEVLLYEETVAIPVRLTVANDAPAGKLELTVVARFQACNDQVCLAPATLPIPLELHLSE